MRIRVIWEGGGAHTFARVGLETRADDWAAADVPTISWVGVWTFSFAIITTASASILSSNNFWAI